MFYQVVVQVLLPGGGCTIHDMLPGLDLCYADTALSHYSSTVFALIVQPNGAYILGQIETAQHLLAAD